MADEGLDGFEPGAIVAGKLRVIRRVGAGGMGAVYEVEHTITKHRRALKVMLAGAGSSPALVQRFLREASAAGHIGSPHVVETYDAGALESGEPYMVMELLAGEPLGARLERGPLPVDESLQIVLQAARGVQAAHDAGIVHRDLKPDNMFLLPGEPLFVKLLDFGISKFDPEQTGELGLTRDGSLMGTPWYMSPEQVRGSEYVDGRSDVYALGVVLYECITGKKPYEAQHMAELAVKIHEGRVAPASSFAAVGSDVDGLIARAMATDVEQRFQSPAALIEAIEQLGQRRALALDATAAAESTAELGAPAASVAGVRAETTSPSGPEAATPGAHGRRLALLGAIGVAVAIALGLVLRSTPDPRPAGSASPIGTERAPPDDAPDAPAPRSSTPSATTDAAPDAPSAVAVAPASAKPPRAPPRPSASTRSQQVLPENPF